MDSSLLDDSTADDGTLGSTYESYFRREYDNRYTTDINNRMQMPDRLGAVSNRLDSMPSANNSAETQLHSIDPTYYMVSTPPRVLTAQHALYSDDDDDDDDDDVLMREKEKLYRHYLELNNGLVSRFGTGSGNQTPKNKSRSDMDSAAVPMTPGTLLAVQSGDEMAVIRRQLGKLISHVRRLEEENQRRQQRELFIYPVVIGFTLYQIAKFFISTKK